MTTASMWQRVAKLAARPALWFCACNLLPAIAAAQCSNPTQVPNQTISSGTNQYTDSRALMASNVTINGSASITFVAGNCIELQPGFRATAGSAGTTFHAWVEAPPTAVSVSPASGGGNTQSFTFTASSPSGYSNIQEIHAFFNTTASGFGACYILYHQPSNSLKVSDGASNGSAGNFSTAISPGSSGTTGNFNPYCTVSGSGTSVSGSGTQLNVTLAVTFQPSFAGNKNTYMFVQDVAGLYTNIQQMGIWAVPGVGQYSLNTIPNPPNGGSVAVSPSCCVFNPGAQVTITALANAPYAFSGFSGVDSANGTTGYVTMNSNRTVSAVFAAVPSPNTIVTSVPSGLILSVDGISCTSPCTFQWSPGTNHAIGASTQSQAENTLHIFGGWSDGGPAFHTISALSTVATTYTANFTTQYYLTTAASPAVGGDVSPASRWYNSGTTVAVSISANAGYQFSEFTGAATGNSLPSYILMNAPKKVTATFVLEGTTPSPSLTEMAVLSLFVKRHKSLVTSGALPANGGLYGLPDSEVATVNSVVDSTNQQLSQLESQAPSYSDGIAYMNARSGILQNLKSQLQSGVSLASWQTLNLYMNTTLAPALSAVSLDASSPPQPVTGASGCEPIAINCLIGWAEINFYNGGGTNHGLGARIESWVEGANAKDFTSTVSLAKETFSPEDGSQPQVIFSPGQPFTVSGGGHAGAVNTDWNPRRGMYQIEAFHSFTYTDPTGKKAPVNYPPFPIFFPPIPPPCSSDNVQDCPIRYLDSNNGYDIYKTRADLRLAVDGASTSGESATITGCAAPITITAVLIPRLPTGNTAPPITWTGGLPGSDNLHRIVVCTPGTTSIIAAIGANLQARLTVTVNSPLIKLEKIGETVINKDNQYSEDTTIRVTAVDSAGQTISAFRGTVGITELGSNIYGQNGGDLPPSVEITNGGSATFVARSLAGPFNATTPPLDAVITSSNFSIYQGQTLTVPQWIISGRKIDPRARGNVYDWLQYRILDIFGKYQTEADVNTVLNSIRSYDTSYLPGFGGQTNWERSATSPITINPFYGTYRLDSPSGGRCGLPQSVKALTDTLLHEGRHAYQASLTVLAANDKDNDFLPVAVGIPPADIIRDSTDVRMVCDQSAVGAEGLSPKQYKGDTVFDKPEDPDFASYAWEYDAWVFASSHVR